MDRTSLTKTSFYAVCLLIGLLGGWTLYKVYVRQKAHKEIVDKIVGIKPVEDNDPLFTPLINSIDNRFSSLVGQSLADDPKSYQVVYLADASRTLATTGDWIRYQGAEPSKVNFGMANFSLSESARAADRTKRQPDGNGQNVGGNAGVGRVEYFIDTYVFDFVLSDIISKCNEAKVHDYNAYSNLVWNNFFPGEKSKYLDVGKIFIGSESSIAVFPYRGKEYRLEVTDRPWWKAAYGAEDGSQKASDFNDLLGRSGNAGLTNIYPDIVSEEGTTDLNRTIWFRFNKYGKRFVLGIDLRLADFSSNILNDVKYELIALAVLGLSLPLLIYARGHQHSAPAVGLDRIYKIMRVERQKVTYNAGQPKMSEFNSAFSVRNVQENKIVNQSSWQFQFDAKPVKATRGVESQTVHLSASSDLIEVTLKKTFDLSLKTGNLKAVELWRVCRPNNDSYVLGVIEALWQNNRNANDITLNQVYWDSNTSASLTDILKELRRHLQTSESGSFIIDQGSVTESEPDIVNILKTNIPHIKDFAIKFESFSNRVLLFDNNVPLVEEIYSNTNCQFFATCSIEFLDNLKRQGRVREVLGLKVDIRYIIDGETRKFKDFYNSLDDDLKQFVEALPNLKIIEYKQSLETIYLNRDFCIMSFGEDRCVLYTDMSDEQAQKGWISWRQVDIEYYDAIKEFIESGGVQKKSINNYLGKS